jgi:hypothetical protein
MNEGFYTEYCVIAKAMTQYSVYPIRSLAFLQWDHIFCAPGKSAPEPKNLGADFCPGLDKWARFRYCI